MLNKPEAIRRWWNTLSPEWQEVLTEQIGPIEHWDQPDTLALDQVTNLDCSYSGIRTLRPLLLFPQLEVLDISGAEVEDFFPLSTLIHLKELHACYCKPFDLYLIEGLDKLEILDLSYPHGKLIHPHVISEFVNLKELFLNAGGLKTVADLLTLEQLTLTTLHFNPMPTEEVHAFADIMQDCRVLF